MTVEDGGGGGLGEATPGPLPSQPPLPLTDEREGGAAARREGPASNELARAAALAMRAPSDRPGTARWASVSAAGGPTSGLDPVPSPPLSYGPCAFSCRMGDRGGSATAELPSPPPPLPLVDEREGGDADRPECLAGDGIAMAAMAAPAFREPSDGPGTAQAASASDTCSAAPFGKDSVPPPPPLIGDRGGKSATLSNEPAAALAAAAASTSSALSPEAEAVLALSPPSSDDGDCSFGGEASAGSSPLAATSPTLRRRLFGGISGGGLAATAAKRPAPSSGHTHTSSAAPASAASSSRLKRKQCNSPPPEKMSPGGRIVSTQSSPELCSSKVCSPSDESYGSADDRGGGGIESEGLMEPLTLPPSVTASAGGARGGNSGVMALPPRLARCVSHSFDRHQHHNHNQTRLRRAASVTSASDDLAAAVAAGSAAAAAAPRDPIRRTFSLHEPIIVRKTLSDPHRKRGGVGSGGGGSRGASGAGGSGGGGRSPWNAFRRSGGGSNSHASGGGSGGASAAQGQDWRPEGVSIAAASRGSNALRLRRVQSSPSPPSSVHDRPSSSAVADRTPLLVRHRMSSSETTGGADYTTDDCSSSLAASVPSSVSDGEDAVSAQKSAFGDSDRTASPVRFDKGGLGTGGVGDRGSSHNHQRDADEDGSDSLSLASEIFDNFENATADGDEALGRMAAQLATPKMKPGKSGGIFRSGLRLQRVPRVQRGSAVDSIGGLVAKRSTRSPGMAAVAKAAAAMPTATSAATSEPTVSAPAKNYVLTAHHGSLDYSPDSEGDDSDDDGNDKDLGEGGRGDVFATNEGDPERGPDWDDDIGCTTGDRGRFRASLALDTHDLSLSPIAGAAAALHSSLTYSRTEEDAYGVGFEGDDVGFIEEFDPSSVAPTPKARNILGSEAAAMRAAAAAAAMIGASGPSFRHREDGDGGLDIVPAVSWETGRPFTSGGDGSKLYSTLSAEARRSPLRPSDNLEEFEHDGATMEAGGRHSIEEGQSIVSPASAGEGTRWTSNTALSLFTILPKADFETVLYLSAYAICGETVRVFTGRLFGVDCEWHDAGAGVDDWFGFFARHVCITSTGTSDQRGGAVFADLPANILGCFVMGIVTNPSAAWPAIPWLSHDHPLQSKTTMHLAIRTGLCGSLTTFASWNSQMVIMMDGTGLPLGSQVPAALFGYLIGLQCAVASFVFGRHIGVYLNRWKNPHLAEDMDAEVAAARRGQRRNPLLRNVRHLRRLSSAITEPHDNTRGADLEAATDISDRDETSSGIRERLGHVWDKLHRKRDRQRRRKERHTAWAAAATSTKSPVSSIVSGEKAVAKPGSKEGGGGNNGGGGGGGGGGGSGGGSKNSGSAVHGSKRRPKSQQRSRTSRHPKSSLSSRPVPPRIIVFPSPTDVLTASDGLCRRLPTLLWNHRTVPFIVVAAFFALYIVGDVAAAIPFYRSMWLSVLFTPPGALLRWKLSKWNGKLSGSRQWIPVGTLAANVLGSLLSVGCYAAAARLATRNDSAWAIHCLAGVRIGFAGSLSTVSTYVKEVVEITERYSGTNARGYLYALGTMVLCCLLGLLVYSPLVRLQ